MSAPEDAAGPTAPAINDQDGLVFRDERPLVVNWKDARAGVRVRLCNAGDSPASRYEVTLNGFSFKHTNTKTEKVETPADADVIEPPSEPEMLPPGQCSDLDVKRKAGTVDSGSYTGVLVVTAAGAGVARREVRIEGPEAAAKAAIAGAADTALLEARRDVPWGKVKLTEGKLPVTAPTEGETLPGDECAPPAKDSEWDAEKCPYIGSLFNGTHVIQVFIAGKPDTTSREGLALIPVRIKGDDNVGDYEGSLDLRQSGDEEEAVKVKLTAKDGWWSAVVALVLGALLPLLLQLHWGRWHPEAKLHDRRKALADKYGDAETNFGDHFGNELPGFARPDTATYSEEVEAAIRAYAKSTLLFDTKSDAYKAIEKSLKDVEDDADLFGSEDGFGKTLTGLRAKLDDVESFVKHQYTLPLKPKLALAAASLLTGATLEVGEVTERSKKAEEHGKLLDSWLELGRRMQGYEVWWRYLAQRSEEASEGEPVMSDPDRERLSNTAAKIIEVRHELIDARDADELKRVGTARDLDTIYARLAYLSSRYGWPDDLNANPATISIPPGAMMLTGGNFDLGELTGDATEWITTAAKVIATAATSATVTRTLHIVGDVVAVVTSLFIAVIAGLSAFYFDKPFGTAVDFLTVIFVGTAAATLSKALLDGLGRFWVRDDAAPEVSSAPAGATVVPVAAEQTAEE